MLKNTPFATIYLEAVEIVRYIGNHFFLHIHDAIILHKCTWILRNKFLLVFYSQILSENEKRLKQVSYTIQNIF